MSTLLVTGGAGFIGANFVYLWRARHPADRIIIMDALTYAGNLANLDALAGDPAVTFIHGDICDETLLTGLFDAHGVDLVVHFAAETHVDRSIANPDPFIRTNVQGTHALLKTALAAWKHSRSKRRFHHVSSDEVYGSLAPSDPPFTETSPYDPRSPYAASKAASDFLVRAYGYTYGLPVTISNCSNNYGPFQFPEKLVPLTILNALLGCPLPLYGDGMNVRDWVHVEDHCAALATILELGRDSGTYNISSGNETTNIELVTLLCELIDRRVRGNPCLAQRFPACPAANGSACRELITYVKDRPGHDRRYALDIGKISRELGANVQRPLADGLALTLDWYMANETWWRSLQSRRALANGSPSITA
jgi:dTDP-glucose 4,6-dehydratase